MSRSYYYLVAGLPDIVLDESKNVPDYSDCLEDIGELVHPDDVALLRILRYPWDNYNLAGLLTGAQQEFDSRGNFTAEGLADEAKSPEHLPGYAVDFLEMRKDGKEPFPGYTVYDQLTWLFLDTAAAHPNVFMREWFGFESDLRNVLAAVNIRRGAQESGGDYRSSLSTVIIGQRDVAEQVTRSTAPDFGLGAMAPWAERVLSLSYDDLVARERALDDLRWATLNDITTFSYFQVEAVLAFCVKLALVHRWMRLDAAEGKKRFEVLIEEMRTGVDVPAA